MTCTLYDRAYENPEPISITERMREAARAFTDQMTGTGQSVEHYEIERNARKPCEDVFRSKLAEQIGDLFMQTQKAFPPAQLDWGIRAGKAKGWVPDLQYPTRLPAGHVKSTSRQWGGDYSWSFQFSDKTKWGTDHLFYLVKDFDRNQFFQNRHNPNHGITDASDFVLFVRLEDAPHPKIGWVMAAVQWRTIINRIPFVDPTKDYLYGLKLCINHKDILKALNAVPKENR